MIYGRHSYMERARSFCVLFLAASVFLMQGLQIHVHTYDHAPEQSDHAHQKPVHFEYMAEQGEEHPDESAPIEIYKYGALKKISFGAALGILFVFVFIVLRRCLVLRPHPLFEKHIVSQLNLGLLPPSRAPPA